MKLFKKQLVYILFSIIFINIQAQTILTVNTDTKLSDVTHNPTGYDLCWFLSEDTSFPNRTKTTEDAIIDLGIGSVRWPYGHLADNYLWTWPLDNNPTVLSPRTASTQLPNETRWPDFFTDVSGSHSELNDNTQDFDEFMTLINNTQTEEKKRVEPVIMVNLLSYLYSGGPTIETLITSAANWVHYANIIKGYNIKYWQIGNEVESELDFDTYFPLYLQFKDAMKAIDPTIKIGFGSFNSGWFHTVSSSYEDQVDFMSLHQYKTPDTGAENYENYRTNSEGPIFYLPKLKTARNKLRDNNSSLKIMLSEFSSHTYLNDYYTNGDANSFFKSMVFFEMLGEILTTPEIIYSHVWGLHNPWNLEGIDDGAGLNNKTNEILPIGFVTKLFATNLKDEMISITRNSSYLRSFASMSNKTEEVTLWILNKNNTSEAVQIDFDNYTCNSILNEFQYTSSSPDALDYTYNSSNHLSLINNQIIGNIPAYSVLVLTLDRFIDTEIRNTIFQNQEHKTVLHNTNIAATDPFNYVQGAPHSWVGENSRWNAISKEDDWILLENSITKEHLWSDGNDVFSAPKSYVGNYAQWKKIPTGNNDEFYLLNREWNKYLNCTNSSEHTTEKHINLTETKLSSTVWGNWVEKETLGFKTIANNQNSIHIYPTVVLDKLTIRLEDLEGENIKIKSFDTFGRTILRQNLIIKNYSEKITFELQHLKQGFFFIEITTSKGTQITKLIKQ